MHTLLTEDLWIPGRRFLGVVSGTVLRLSIGEVKTVNERREIEQSSTEE